MDSIPQLRAPADSVDVFVCSHMKRDARCGRLGPPIAAAFTKGTHEFCSLSCPFALLFVSVFRSYAYRILPLLLCQYLTVLLSLCSELTGRGLVVPGSPLESHARVWRASHVGGHKVN